MAYDRNIEGYWAVWHHGMEWPALFYSEQSAKAQVVIWAKQDPGKTVHLCRIEPVGTMKVPYEPEVSGRMTELENVT